MLIFGREPAWGSSHNVMGCDVITCFNMDEGVLCTFFSVGRWLCCTCFKKLHESAAIFDDWSKQHLVVDQQVAIAAGKRIRAWGDFFAFCYLEILPETIIFQRCCRPNSLSRSFMLPLPRVFWKIREQGFFQDQGKNQGFHGWKKPRQAKNVSRPDDFGSQALSKQL